MSGVVFPPFAAPCAIESGSGIGRFRFSLTAPFNDGLPGGATVGVFQYRPHAVYFAAAPAMHKALESLVSLLDADLAEGISLTPEQETARNEAIAAIALARGEK